MESDIPLDQCQSDRQWLELNDYHSTRLTEADLKGLPVRQRVELLMHHRTAPDPGRSFFKELSPEEEAAFKQGAIKALRQAIGEFNLKREDV